VGAVDKCGHIGVAVDEGMVTLSGHFDSFALNLALPLGAVKTGIEAALRRRAATDARNIAVEVRGTRMALAGTVHSWSKRDLAMTSARGIPGLKVVVDSLGAAY